jgi:predicted transcriptional regulator
VSAALASPTDEFKAAAIPPHPYSESWKAFVARKLRERGMRRRELARLASIDPSYVTLFLDGYVPRHTVVRRVGAALGSLHEALDAAGFKAELDTAGLSYTTLDLVERLRSLPTTEQDALTAQLRAYLDRHLPFFYPAG